MKTLTLNIDDNIYDEFMTLLKSKYYYKISIIDDDIFTKEDEKAYRKGITQLEKGEALSLEQLKAGLDV
jgi:Ni2+-binding GTPase involved in maturation of urease and hydrogenase